MIACAQNWCKRKNEEPKLITSILSTTDMSISLQHNNKPKPQSKLRYAHVKLALSVQEGTKDTPNSAKPPEHFLPDRGKHSTQHKREKKFRKTSKNSPKKNPGTTTHLATINSKDREDGTQSEKKIHSKAPPPSPNVVTASLKNPIPPSSCVREASTTTTRTKKV
jgi:hypothetical protein